MLQLLDQQEVAKTMVTEVMSAVTTGMTSAVSDISTGISGLIPVVIPVAAAIIAIGIGMRVVHKFAALVGFSFIFHLSIISYGWGLAVSAGSYFLFLQRDLVQHVAQCG